MLHRLAMRVLLTGATGFVGGAILRALLQGGHEIVAALRSVGSRTPLEGVTYRELDFMRPPEPSRVIELVSDVDAVVNAVGIIREARGQTFQKLHAETPLCLFAAAQEAHVKRIIQISAAGTMEESPFEYFRSKAKADQFLLEKCSVSSLVLRPSLVYGERGEATALFRQLAALPLIPLPAGGQFSFRPILVEDLTTLVVEGLDLQLESSRAVEVGGADEMTLEEILLAIRASRTGTEGGKGTTLGIPKMLMKPAAWFGDLTGVGPLTSDMLEMLVTSDAPDLTKMHEVFRHRPCGLSEHLAHHT